MTKRFCHGHLKELNVVLFNLLILDSFKESKISLDQKGLSGQLAIAISNHNESVDHIHYLLFIAVATSKSF